MSTKRRCKIRDLFSSKSTNNTKFNGISLSIGTAKHVHQIHGDLEVTNYGREKQEISDFLSQDELDLIEQVRSLDPGGKLHLAQILTKVAVKTISNVLL